MVDLSGEEKGPPDMLTNTPNETQSSAYDTAFHGTAMDTVTMAMITRTQAHNTSMGPLGLFQYNFHITVIVAEGIHNNIVISIEIRKNMMKSVKIICFKSLRCNTALLLELSLQLFWQ